MQNSAVSSAAWRWPNFAPREIACPCCGEICVDEPSLDALQSLRTAWGKPIILNSAHRCPRHNRAVGGVENSMHLTLAFDCAVPATEQAAFVALARQAGFKGIGSYPGRGFVHLDTGRQRAW